MKIKEAYGLAKAAEAQRLVDSGDVDTADLERRGRDAGRTATLDAVHRLTGIAPNLFAEVNLDGFYELARAIGGPGTDADAHAVGNVIGVDSSSSDDRIPTGHVVVTLGNGFDTVRIGAPSATASSGTSDHTDTGCVD